MREKHLPPIREVKARAHKTAHDSKSPTHHKTHPLGPWPPRRRPPPQIFIQAPLLIPFLEFAPIDPKLGLIEVGGLAPATWIKRNHGKN